MIPESLLDEPLDGLPYIDMFYRHTGRATAAKGSGGGLAWGRIPQTDAADCSGYGGIPHVEPMPRSLPGLTFSDFQRAGIPYGAGVFSLGGSRSLHRKCVPRVVCTLHSAAFLAPEKHGIFL